MSQQLLHCANVVAIFQQVGRKTYDEMCGTPRILQAQLAEWLV
jgi:hypothetical protein